MILSIPSDIKLTYIIIIIVMIFFVGFIIFVVLMYNRKQILYIKEKQLQDAEFRNQILEKELEKQKSIQNERTRISRDMHDEIGAGISAIKLQSEILKQQIRNTSINISEIDELIHISENMNLSMREMLWSLNTANDRIDSFSDYCKNHLENYFSKTNIDFEFSKTIVDSRLPITSEIRRNILMVIKEAAHNIIKHSSAKSAKLEINQNHQTLLVMIRDNGKGFNISEPSSGYGLSSMKSRIESLGGILDLISGSSGTYITITIDLKNNNEI